MVEYLKCKKYPDHGARYGKAWQRSVMMTDVPPDDVGREKAWAEHGNPTEASDRIHLVQQQIAKIPHFGQGCWPMFLTPSALDVYFTVDGLTVYDCRSEHGMGGKVFLEKGGCLPTYVHPDCGKSPCHKSVSKQHYLMLVGPQGFCVCAAMKSGSHLWPGKRTDDPLPVDPSQTHRKFLWWWDLIPEHLTASDLDGQDPTKVQHEMAATQWLVRSIQNSLCLQWQCGLYYTSCHTA